MNLRSSFDVALVTDTHIIILDRDEGASVTNDARAVVDWLDKNVGGIGKRKLYYRGTTGRFDELSVSDGQFSGFCACTDSQQISLHRMVEPADAEGTGQDQLSLDGNPGLNSSFSSE